MNLKLISKDDLKQRIENTVQNERRCIREVVEYIAEVDRRQIFIEWGFASLFEFLTRYLKYSEASAYRRMQAARTLRQIPELGEQLDSGALNLTQISKAQTAFKAEEKATGHRISVEEKRAIFCELRNQTKRATEKILDTNLASAVLAPSPIERVKADDSVELTVRIPKEVMKKIEKVKHLLGHIVPDGNWVDILDKMSDDVISKRDPARPVKVLCRTNQQVLCRTNKTETAVKFSRNEIEIKKAPQRFAAAEVVGRQKSSSPAIPAHVRRMVFKRDQNCQHRQPNGEICGSLFRLEIDHVHPKFAGGTNDLQNLRVYCRAHNQYRYKIGAGLL